MSQLGILPLPPIAVAALGLVLASCGDDNLGKVRMLEADLAEATSEVDDLGMQLDAATARADGLEMQLYAKNEEIRELRERLAALDFTVSDYARQVAELEAELEAAETAARMLQDELADLQEAAAQLQEEIAARDARDERNAANLNIARGQFYGLSMPRYLRSASYGFGWMPGELAPSKPRVGPDMGGAFRVPMALSDETEADDDGWKSELFTGELAVSAEESETGRAYGVVDTASVYSKEMSDVSYLYFGWWQRRRTGDGPRVYFNAAPAGAVGLAPSRGIAALTGTATYTGPAVGRVGIYNPVGGHNWGSSFNASATINVDFGTAAPGTARVSGTVDDFTVRGESRDWTVTLMEAGLNDGTGFAGVRSAGTSWTGLTDPRGGCPSCWWGAQFHGSDAEGMPQGVTGAFRTEHRNVGRMLGSFGATRE